MSKGTSGLAETSPAAIGSLTFSLLNNLWSNWVSVPDTPALGIPSAIFSLISRSCSFCSRFLANTKQTSSLNEISTRQNRDLRHEGSIWIQLCAYGKKLTGLRNFQKLAHSRMSYSELPIVHRLFTDKSAHFPTPR